ncbi:MFS transporter [Rhizobium sp. 768_B6_N1_8]|uniref:MFS transporter n=1 Tax=unclassified Rhizobium TaxID=2613769 RepID=UPI003F25867E
MRSLLSNCAPTINALLPIVSTSVLDLSSVGFGLLSCAFGFGALLAALSVGNIQAKLGFERMLLVADGGVQNVHKDIVSVEEIFRLQDMEGTRANERRYLR